MSTPPEPRVNAARGRLAVTHDQGTDHRDTRPLTQPALTRCGECQQLFALLDDELCEACAAKG